jgi:membrane associated rhomboid family serine protease
MRTRIGTGAIFCIMGAVFLFEVARNAPGNDARLLNLGALPDSGQIDWQYWRLITAGFLHYNFSHVVLNMLLLLLLGPIVERRAGMVWLLVIFLIASVASCLAIILKHQVWPSQGVSLGASGGMFGLLGAALVLAFRSGAESRRVRTGLVVALVLGLTYSVLPNVSMVGHIIGLAVGATAGLLSTLHPAPSTPTGP